MPKRAATSVWISARRSGPRAVSYSSRDYLELYKAMLAMVRIAPAAVPPEQS